LSTLPDNLIMQYDPHQTGSPPKPIEPTGFFTGIRFRPIVMGAVVDLIATFALVAFYYRFYVAPNSGATEALEEEAAKYWATGDGLVMSLLLGSLGTLIGGFYAAYKAGTLEMKHGALVGVCSIIVGLLMQPSGSENQAPEWVLALSLAAAIPAGALGGFFAEMFSGMTGKKSSTSRLSTDR
jgi:putative membrane protein (TIGR04086 family)